MRHSVVGKPFDIVTSHDGRVSFSIHTFSQQQPPRKLGRICKQLLSDKWHNLFTRSDSACAAVFSSARRTPTSRTKFFVLPRIWRCAGAELHCVHNPHKSRVHDEFLHVVVSIIVSIVESIHYHSSNYKE